MFNFHTHTHHESAIVNIDSIDSTQFKPNHYYSFGNHPWNIQYSIDEIEKVIVNNPQIIAIGECGIDKLKSNKSISEQISVLKEQIQLSERLQFPLILHIVNGYNEVMQLKKEYNPKQKWIIHGFNKYKQSTALLKQDFYLSFGVALLKNKVLQDVVLHCPVEKIMLETDDSNVCIEKMYNFVANSKGIRVEDLIVQIKENINTVTNGKLA